MVVAVSCQVQGGGEHASIKSRQNVGVGAVAEKEEGGVGGVVEPAGEIHWRHLGRRGREGLTHSLTLCRIHLKTLHQ